MTVGSPPEDCACAEALVFWRSQGSGGARGSQGSPAEMTQAEKGDAENGKEKGGEKEKEQRGVKRPIVPALVPESLQEVRRRGRVSVRAWHPSLGSRLLGLAGKGRLETDGRLGAPIFVGGVKGGANSPPVVPCWDTRARRHRALQGQAGSSRGH